MILIGWPVIIMYYAVYAGFVIAFWVIAAVLYVVWFVIGWTFKLLFYAVRGIVRMIRSRKTPPAVAPAEETYYAESA